MRPKPRKIAAANARAGDGRHASARDTFRRNVWLAAAISLAAVLLGVVIYGPAMHGPFLFDDLFLPFANPAAPLEPLSAWLLGVRPTLMFSYWLNYQMAGASPSAFHLFNVEIHAINSILAFLVALNLFQRAGLAQRNRLILAAFCGVLFLVHPLETESVAYIAGRSESLASCFFLAAYSIFLYRKRAAVSWRVSAAIVVLFALAVTTKENMAALAPALILTDCFWNSNGAWNAIKANWRLYAPLAIFAAGGLLFIAEVLSTSKSAGFHLSGVAWYQYFFTETRAIWVYLGLFVFPIAQSADHDFSISHTAFEHGAAIAFAALCVAAAAAFRARKRYPLGSFGFFLFLLLLAPTSSVIPISDALVERRMYLPVLALSLVAAQFLSRYDLRDHVTMALLCIPLCLFGVAAYRRNRVWSDERAFWADAVNASPDKSRPYWNLTQAAVARDNCDAPVPYLREADRTMPNDPLIVASWAKVLGCKGHFDEALAKLRQSEKLQPPSSVTLEMEGLLYGEMGKLDESKAALDKAIEVDPGYESAYLSRGLWYESKKDYAAALADYRTAAALNPMNSAARMSAARVQSEMKRFSH